MPEYPEDKPITTSSGKFDISFNPPLPIVHSLNSFILTKEGWERNGSTYTKNGKEIIYDGVYWKQNGGIIQFLEDIK